MRMIQSILITSKKNERFLKTKSLFKFQDSKFIHILESMIYYI